VTGTADPGATVDVDAVNTDGDGAAVSASTTAGADGSFTVDVTPPAGTVAVTVTATNPAGATGFAQRTVVNDVVPGTNVFTLADEAGDDNGSHSRSTTINFGELDAEKLSLKRSERLASDLC
jgi:hypothetical protein